MSDSTKGLLVAAQIKLAMQNKQLANARSRNALLLPALRKAASSHELLRFIVELSNSTGTPASARAGTREALVHAELVRREIEAAIREATS